MITNSNIACIIADDLTGANDTALQFRLNGADTNILLNKDNIIKPKEYIPQVWAMSTESRNVAPKDAFEKVRNTVEFLIKEINPDYFYKKIDSTIRGNIAVEVMSMLETLDWDGAVIMPAFPLAGRITVGGYQLLKGVPIERTEMAVDPHSPITESHLPTLLKKQLGQNLEHLVGMIELKTVLDGAGPILMKLNELISEGKRIIIADSVSITDIEQIILAMKKSNYKILPVGNAAAAKVLSNVWFPHNENAETEDFVIPKLPKLIISGSATQITANQISEFILSQQSKDNSLIIELNMNTVLSEVEENLVNQIVSNLQAGKNVLVHTSNLIKNFDGFAEDAIKADLTKSGLANVITDYLASLTQQILSKTKAILITLGGETSYKCANSINANHLKQITEVQPAIALSKNINSDQLIVTKSGNLGTKDTIIKILEYFER